MLLISSHVRSFRAVVGGVVGVVVTVVRTTG
jgi:hypothetical protein